MVAFSNSSGFDFSSSHVSIEDWDGQVGDRNSDKIYRHFDIGSANYGPKPNHSDAIHNVLFRNADRIINEHPEHSEFVFYLNDFLPEGLYPFHFMGTQRKPIKSL